ncbi:glycosyltransferase family 2 protein [Prevotella sp.]|uniref:glycosyltransferase family 2 protein n=1 Tax=Prevotella sp. TaxID=59823 RepID=UPI004027A0EB
MIKISIIVAVFNDEKHIAECLDSLVEQTLHDIQIICIDDCSTDNSLSIVKQYAARDKRIEVISLEANQGQAKARNIGLKIAKGQYITFLDSDDWLSKDALEEALDTFEQNPLTDSVLLKLMLCTGNPQEYKGEMFKNQDFEMYSGKEAFELCLDWSIHGVYVARKDLFDKYPYDDTCHAYSDDNTTRAHYLHSREVRICDGIYFYRYNPTSTTNKVSARRFLQLRADESMKHSLYQWNISENIIKRFENIRWLHMIDVYKFYYLHAKDLNKNDRKFGLDEIHRTWQLIDHKILTHATRSKFGFMPMPCWTLFRIQEWVYFSLRQILGRNG